MTSPTVEDFTVYRRDAETLEISSWRTRGRCATVYKFSFSENLSVQEFLIPRYMQGISHGMILEAANQFLVAETKGALEHTETCPLKT